MKSLAAVTLALVLAAPPALAQGPAGSLSRPAEVSDLRGMPDSFRDLSRRLMPAVVNISTSQAVAVSLPVFPEGSPAERFNEFFGRDRDGFQRRGSLGSGFVISADGYIVTNTHVIDQADTIEVTFSDGRSLQATLVGRDRDSDIAVLKVTSRTPLSFVEFADSDTAEVGDWVIAIGNPLGFGGSVSAGIVSATGRDLNTGRSDNFIQTDAAINQGNSGGPLFNLSGQVVGVNTAIISQTGGSIGLGFSVPSNTARRISRQLIDDGRVRRPWLGVNVQDADEALLRAYRANARSGVIITRISEDSPAARARLSVGDLITSMDGRAITSVREMTRRLAELPIGQEVTFAVLRDGRAREVSISLGELPDDEPAPGAAPSPETAVQGNDLGADLVNIDDDVRRRFSVPRDASGVVVTAVSTRGRAAGKLQRGDIIAEVNFEAVSSVSDTNTKIQAARGAGRQPVVLRLKRRGEGGVWIDQYVAIEFSR